MKILHINRNYLGTELHHHLIDELDSRGIENYVFAPTSRRKVDCNYINEQVVVSRCFNKMDRVNYFIKQQKIFNSLNRSFDVSKFDIIHAYTLFTDGFSAYRIFKERGIPYVVAIRDTDVNAFLKLNPWLRSLGVKIMEHASQVFFLSSSYLEFVLSHYIPVSKRDFIKRKSCIMPNGIDDFWHENAMADEVLKEKIMLKDGSIRIVCVGRICRRKNIPITQKAVRILKEKGYNIKLTLVGKIDDNRIFHKIIKDENTIYFKPVPKKELIYIYRENDIFVMPSLTETFGLVYAEAMSQGLPVVYSKGQGFDGQFPEGEVGYAVEASDAQSVAEGIEKVLKNYSDIVSRVVRLSGVFEWKLIADRYNKIYESIINARK